MTSHRLGLVGSGIDQSLSPAFHELAGDLVGLDVSYDLIPRDPRMSTDRRRFLGQLATEGYQGLNITVPFKASAWQTATDPSTEVVTTGVANTLLLGVDGPSHAFNTDFSGFKWAYERAASGPNRPAAWHCSAPAAWAPPPRGTGRPGRSGDADLRHRPRPFTGARPAAPDPQPERPRRGRHLGRGSGRPRGRLSSTGHRSGCTGTPATPVDLSAVGSQRWIFDAIYSPIETPLMVQAANGGLARITGFDLFLGQAIIAFEIFTGHRLAPDVLSDLEASLTVLERQRGV